MDQRDQNTSKFGAAGPTTGGPSPESSPQPVRLLALLGASILLLLLLLVLWLVPAVWLRSSEGESVRVLAAAYDNVAQARAKTDTARAISADSTQVLERLKSVAPPAPPPAGSSGAAAAAGKPSNDAIREATARLAAAKDQQAQAEAAQARAERDLAGLRERQELDARRLTAESESRRIAIPIVGGLFFITAIFTYRAVGAMERSLRAAQAAARIAQEELRAKQAKIEQEERAASRTLEMAAETLRAAHERMQSERFARATESLDRDKPLSVRLGAIYSLERLLKDMTSVEDRGAALKVLTAYLREQRPSPEEAESPPDSSEQGTDIQAVAAVLRQWRRRDDDPTVDLRGAWLPSIWLGGADLSGALLDRADLRRANLTNIGLRGAKLTGAELTGAYLSGADLREADLSEVTLAEADLAGANLSRAGLRGADLAGANLSTADLSEADLSEADLSGTRLSGAILRGADLRKTYLIQVDLNGAHLSGAKLYDTDLSGADLGGATLTGADLGGADLRFAANLTQEQLDAAVTNARTQVTAPLIVPGVAPGPVPTDHARPPHAAPGTASVPSVKRSSPRRRLVSGKRRSVRPEPLDRAPAERDERREGSGEPTPDGRP
jgi:uncharacterized protein YjbI with pentapeptide repeats